MLSCYFILSFLYNVYVITFKQQNFKFYIWQATSYLRLPELLQPAVPAQIYRYIRDFLASNPTPEQIAEFKPTPEMQERLLLPAPFPLR